jgi:ABC-type uncharacterized transport system permease subunit
VDCLDLGNSNKRIEDFKMNKILYILLIGLIVIVLAGAIFLAIPKYQVEMVRLDNDTVMITKINTLTGKTETYYRESKKAKEIYEYIEGKGHYNKN